MNRDPSAHVYAVPESAAGLRLDHFLVQHVPHMTRALASELAAAGEVRVNGRRAKKGDRLAGGAEVQLRRVPEPAEFTPAPWAGLTLHVLYEDEHVVVVDKPRGLPTHPLLRHEQETLAQALLHRYPEMAGVGYALREPGILHRLDTDTSGVLVAARSAPAFDALRSSQRAGQWTKEYVALCEGLVRTPDRIEAALAPDPSDPRRMQVREARRTDAPPGPDEAPARVTELVAARSLGALRTADGARVQVSAVTVRAEKATRHQIRVHLAYYGHPLLGDTLYGGAALAERGGDTAPPGSAGIPGDTALVDDTALEGDSAPGAHWLHASRISFPHPMRAGERVEAEAPDSDEMSALARRAADGLPGASGTPGTSGA